MKNFKITTILLIFSVVILSMMASCKKDENHLGKKKNSEILKWQYSLQSSSNSASFEIETPAIDENDNIYVFSYSNNADKIVSLTNTGSLRWEKEISGNVVSRVGYKNEKIIFISYDKNTNPSQNVLNILNSESGAIEKTMLISHYSKGFALKNDGIILFTDDNINLNFHITKVDYSGNITASSPLNITNSLDFNCIDVFNNDIFVMTEIGNTNLAHVWKFTDNGTSFAKEWDTQISSENGFSETQNNTSADMAINDNGDVYFTTNRYLFALKGSDGSVMWRCNNFKTNDLEIKINPILTDSANVILSFKNLYKINSAGILKWNIENENYGTIIGSNKKYYTIEPNGSFQGIKSINSDGSKFWYSLTSISVAYPGMLHNGNLVYIYDNDVYCIETEALGIDKTAQWPKIYYDYGNTCYKTK